MWQCRGVIRMNTSSPLCAGAWRELDRRENVAFRACGQAQTFRIARPAACRCAVVRCHSATCLSCIFSMLAPSRVLGAPCMQACTATRQARSTHAAVVRGGFACQTMSGPGETQATARILTAPCRQGIPPGDRVRAGTLVGQLCSAGRTGPAAGLACRAG